MSTIGENLSSVKTSGDIYIKTISVKEISLLLLSTLFILG